MFEVEKKLKRGSLARKNRRCNECQFIKEGRCEIAKDNVNKDGNCPYWVKQGV